MNENVDVGVGDECLSIYRERKNCVLGGICWRVCGFWTFGVFNTVGCFLFFLSLSGFGI